MALVEGAANVGVMALPGLDAWAWGFGVAICLWKTPKMGSGVLDGRLGTVESDCGIKKTVEQGDGSWGNQHGSGK